MGKSKESDDPIKAVADSLREKKGIAWSVAKLDLEGDGTRVEFFRGKDFARYFRENPGKIPNAIQKSGKGLEEQIADLYQQLLKRGLILKTNRKFKKPKPGKKRLVKFPKTLEPYGPDLSWTEDAFYAWQYDRPTSIWFYIASALLVVVVVGSCLFPLAPYWMRMALVYFLMSVLAIILTLIVVRYILFGVVWILTGRHFWLFPNMMSEEAGVLEAFKPVVSFNKPEGGGYQILSRIATLAMSAGLIYMLYTHSPDNATMRANAKKAHDSFLEFLDLHGSKAKLSGSTAPNPSTPQGSEGPSGGPKPTPNPSGNTQGQQKPRQGARTKPTRTANKGGDL